MDYMIWLSFYKDVEFSEKAWSKEQFDELSRGDLNDLVLIYNSCMDRLSNEEMKKIAISSNFTNYFYLCSDNVSEFFGKKILDLTFFQTMLASYGRLFKNIQENNSDIPESVLSDPDALMDFAKSKNSEGQGASSKARDSEGGYSRVGATTEDMIDAGVSSKAAKGLHSIAEEKGRALNWQDFATLS